MRTRTTMARPAAGAVAAVLMFSAFGCSSGDGPAGSTATTTTAAPTPTTARATTLEPGDRYVALGSSIASGFGISVQSSTCGRSSRNYPNLIAQHYELELTDVSCGAAQIPNVVDTAQGEHPPQLNALTPDTKLVTVTVGGNDIGYNATALVCGDPSNVCSAPPGLDAAVSALPGALLDMIERIQAAAPSATVVFVTYPREIPDGNCPALSYTDAEADVVRSMGRQLERAFLTVAGRADIVFVDPYPAAGDHTGCAPPSERWTAGHVPDDGFAYHPTALGHQVMADMIVEALDQRS